MAQGLEATAGILVKLGVRKEQGTTASMRNARFSVELSSPKFGKCLDGFVEKGKLCVHTKNCNILFWHPGCVRHIEESRTTAIRPAVTT